MPSKSIYLVVTLIDLPEIMIIKKNSETMGETAEGAFLKRWNVFKTLAMHVDFIFVYYLIKQHYAESKPSVLAHTVTRQKVKS